MAMTAESVKLPANGTLSPAQWQTLGRLADRYQSLEETGHAIAREFGGVLTSGTLAAAELVQNPNFMHNLRELNETLNVLVETGLLARLRELLYFVAESAEYLDRDRMVAGFVRAVERLPFKQGEAASKAGVSHAQGGWRGLMHMLRDPEVQSGLEVMARLSQQLAGGGK